MTLPTGVDGTVWRIATEYEVRGLVDKITSHDNATVGQGNVVNEVQLVYNDFGQLTHDFQAHGGAVNTSTTPKVQYSYADGSANSIRPTSLTYPNGRVIIFDYGSAGGNDDNSSRMHAIKDGATELATYAYLGLSTVVEVDYTQPDVKHLLYDPGSTNNIYSGLDRLSRIVDSRWYDYGSSQDVDRIKYGYERATALGERTRWQRRWARTSMSCTATTAWIGSNTWTVAD